MLSSLPLMKGKTDVVEEEEVEGEEEESDGKREKAADSTGAVTASGVFSLIYSDPATAAAGADDGDDEDKDDEDDDDGVSGFVSTASRSNSPHALTLLALTDIKNLCAASVPVALMLLARCK